MGDRNRRMFGALVGTLQKFNKEEIKKKDVLEKKKVVEKKVEEKTEREKEEMRNRKRELFDEQRKKKKDIQILQIQLKRTEEFEAWEASKKSEVNFIRTKGEQNPIYWLPKNHSEKTEGLLSETKTAVEKELEEKREAFEQELVGIERRKRIGGRRREGSGGGRMRREKMQHQEGRVVRMEKSNEDKAEIENEPRRTSSRNGVREDERRGETKSPVAKSGAPLAKRSKEPTPDAAEGEKRMSARKRQRSRKEAEREKRGSSESSSEEERRPRKRAASSSSSPHKSRVSSKSSKKKKNKKESSSSSSESSDSD